jgi:hypothetical protein
MKTTKTRKWCLAAAASLALTYLPGCELLVQFDRNKIDGGVVDSTAPDSLPVEDSSTGADTTVEEPGVDAAEDTAEASQEADGGGDATTDGDANEDAEDALGDADVSAEEGADSGEDAAESGLDSSEDSPDSSNLDSGDAE